MFETILHALEEGKLVAIPTDTTFGVMCDAGNPQAVEELYAFKGRPEQRPFQVLVNSQEMAHKLAKFSPAAERMTQKFWPGALTLVLPRSADSLAAKNVCGALTTIGLRWPDSALVCDIIARLGRPLAASSVNTTGEMPLNEAAMIRDTFPSLTVMDGMCAGNASTVAELRGGEIIVYRQGAVTEQDLKECL